jgi:uroporphyrinogen decarboxylase
MTPRERLTATVRLDTPDRVPVIPIGNFPLLRIGGLATTELVEQSTRAAEIILECQREFRYDCVYGRIGQNYEVEALGGRLRAQDDAHPAVEKPYLIGDAGDIADLDPQRLRTHRALTAESDVIRTLRREAGGEVPVMAYCQGPMRMAAQLVGAQPLMFAIADRPGFVADALDFAVEVSSVKADMALSSGSDLIFVSDPTASEDLISPQMYAELVLPRARRLIGAIKAAGHVAVIYHICGDTTRIIPFMAETGTDIVSVDSKVDLAAARSLLSYKACLMGNLDPVGLMLNGAPPEVEAEAARCIRLFEGGRGFVLSGGCALPIGTPAENIRALVSAAEVCRTRLPAQ